MPYHEQHRMLLPPLHKPALEIPPLTAHTFTSMQAFVDQQPALKAIGTYMRWRQAIAAHRPIPNIFSIRIMRKIKWGIRIIISYLKLNKNDTFICYGVSYIGSQIYKSRISYQKRKYILKTSSSSFKRSYISSHHRWRFAYFDGCAAYKANQLYTHWWQ